MFLCITIKFWDIGADFGSYSPSSLLWKKRREYIQVIKLKRRNKFVPYHFKMETLVKVLATVKKNSFYLLV